ncbi:Uncharacterised protein [Klebsiella pneumoniae subsp. ozaenae]|uniref:Uncharacterized protein n=1 Tax=Klebsiella pneumoniae subsp. ozaenae TaxID=574 RepID=A0A377Z583_KLEPO|nr:Uncharacterised protein [Klebsiella pneumoniae subsp. ozaenae]
MQAVELLVCQPDQIIQRQPLGEFAEPVAGAGADQRIEIAPVVRQLRRLCNLLPQRLLLLTALCVLPELLADLTLAGSVIRSRWARACSWVCRVGTSASTPCGRSARCASCCRVACSQSAAAC